ncbi:hypothetical protein CFP66_37545 [Pseudonocardia sp. MH-G8]|nr:hypothetical protein CFP66_37545 [Pseudonocardia sp. MH-G8]
MVLNATFYLVAGGIAGAALPHDFPPHQTVYGLFRRWVMAGAWQQIHDALRGDEVGRRGDAAEIARFADGFELLEPGLMSPSLWRPNLTEVGRPEPVHGFAAVGR